MHVCKRIYATRNSRSKRTRKLRGSLRIEGVPSALHYAVNCAICPRRCVESRGPRLGGRRKGRENGAQLIFNCAPAVIQPSYFRRSRDVALDTRSARLLHHREGRRSGREKALSLSLARAPSVHQRRPSETSRKTSDCVTSSRKFSGVQFGYCNTLYTVPRLKAC